MKANLALHGGTPVREKFLPFSRPTIGPEEEQAVLDVLRSGWLTTGPRTKEFERVFAARLGARHAVALSSCTAALHLALLAAEVGPGDEVVTSPITFASTANVILHAGARPVFADVEPDSLNLDPAAFEACITPRTRAVIPVHLAGLPCAMDRIGEIARRHGVTVIEDAAQAVGASHGGRMVGTISPLTCFSFYATKNITTGEGGMLTCASDEQAEKVRLLALHGLSRDAWKRYEPGEFRPWKVLAPGYKCNMGDVQAALGLCQLARLESFQERRDRLVERYRALLAGLSEVRPLAARPPARSANHLFVVVLEIERLRADRNQVATAMQAENVGVGVHFEAVHLHPYYAGELGYPRGIAPRAEHASERVLSLPLCPSMSDADQDDAVAALAKVLAAYRA